MPGRRPVPFISGENSVLAFVGPRALESATPDLLSCLRAQLRGLGAVLLVLSPGGRLCLRPDDEPLRAPLPEDELRGLCRGWGVEPAALRGDALSVFVLDARGHVRHTQHVSSPEEPLLLLSRCLTQALRERERQSGRLALTRRELCAVSLASGVSLVLAASCSSRQEPYRKAPPQPQTSDPRPNAPPSAAVPVRLRVNGQTHALELPVQASLLDTLRERLGLTGTKKGCDHGQCGACTVLLDGQRVNACLTLAVMAEDREITTIEGLARGDALHPLQQAFVRCDGYQCGYCTPGQIMSALGLLQEGRAHTDDEIREQMSGNLCRCGAYNNILAAIRSVAKDGA